VAWWRPAGGHLRGTIFIYTGRTEFIEKYFEFIGECCARGYGVVCFDWRGQGLSQRLLDDVLKGHVGRFSDYDLDADCVLSHAVTAGLPRPFILFGHSMGGHIALRHLARRPQDYERAFLSAPMLKAWMSALAQLASRPMAALQCALGRGTTYVPGTAPSGLPHVFEGNKVTTDQRRFERNEAIVRAEPALALAGPTWSWAREAFASMAMLRSPTFARRIICPLMIVGAAHDRIVHQGPDMTVIRHVKRGLFVLFSNAEHELVQERDDVRRVFWNAADAFLDAPL
jgi:lysophospholipase